MENKTISKTFESWVHDTASRGGGGPGVPKRLRSVAFSRKCWKYGTPRHWDESIRSKKMQDLLLARPRTLCCPTVFKPNLKVLYLSQIVWRISEEKQMFQLQESLLHFHKQDCKVNFANTPVMHFTFRMLKSSNLPEICCTDSLSACQGGRPPGVYTIVGLAIMQLLWNKDERAKNQPASRQYVPKNLNSKRVWVFCASRVRP